MRGVMKQGSKENDARSGSTAQAPILAALGAEKLNRARPIPAERSQTDLGINLDSLYSSFTSFKHLETMGNLEVCR